MKEHHKTRLVVACLTVVVTLPGCQEAPAEGKTEAGTRKPVAVRTEKAEVRLLRPSFEVIGQVVTDPERVATLTSAAPGMVQKLAVREGTRVKAGDVIIQLAEAKAKNDFDRAHTAYLRLIAKPRLEEEALARAALDKARAAYDVAQAKLKGVIELRGRNAALVPELQLMEDKRLVEVARAEMESMEAQLGLLLKGPRQEQRRVAEVETEAAELGLKWCRVTSPIGGEVVEILARVGQRADVGIPLATVMDTSEVLVHARVPSARLESLTRAMEGTADRAASPAKVHAAAYPDEVFLGAVTRLGAQTEAQTSDVTVWVRVPNPKGLLRVGMTVRLELFGAETSSLAVPEAAVSMNGEGNRVVTLVRDGKAYPAEIRLAASEGQEVRAGGWVRVASGLKAGDEVAIENGYALPTGFPVTVMPPKPPKGGIR
jgi:HlyD family secretion protein